METMSQTMFSIPGTFPEMAMGEHQSSGIPFGCLPMRNTQKKWFLWKRYVMDLWVPN